MNHLSFTIFILCLTSITGNQVTPTQSYSLLEDDIVIYDDDEIFEGEFLEAEVRHWPKTGNEVLIPYVKKTILSDRIKEKALKRAISEFNTNTCIRFVERQKNETDYLEIDLDSLKCASVVGRKGGKQKVRIGGCIDKQDKFSYGMVIHELMHSIGFTHEHSRTDRNAFIEIDYDAIRKVEEDDFVPNGTYARKFLRCNETELGRRFSCKLINSYDKASIMHYSNRIGSINAREVFKSKQPCPNNDCKFGQRKYLSPMDIKDIEDAYGCVKPTEMSVIMKAFQQLKENLEREIQRINTSHLAMMGNLTDDISGIDGRVDNLEKTVVKRCLVDSDCSGALHFCIDGWCSVAECKSDNDCDIAHEYCVTNACKTLSGYDYRLNTYINGNDLDTFGDLNSAITYCNSHSNCNGVFDFYCDGYFYYAATGQPIGSSIGSCSWVKN